MTFLSASRALLRSIQQLAICASTKWYSLEIISLPIWRSLQCTLASEQYQWKYFTWIFIVSIKKVRNIYSLLALSMSLPLHCISLYKYQRLFRPLLLVKRLKYYSLTDWQELSETYWPFYHFKSLRSSLYRMAWGKKTRNSGSDQDAEKIHKLQYNTEFNLRLTPDRWYIFLLRKVCLAYLLNTYCRSQSLFSTCAIQLTLPWVAFWPPWESNEGDSAPIS